MEATLIPDTPLAVEVLEDGTLRWTRLDEDIDDADEDALPE